MARPIELDKPSMAPIQSSSTDDIHLQNTRLNDHTGIVARDTDGHVAYPYFIPPDIESPTSLKNAPYLNEGPKKVRSEPLAEKPETEPVENSRPILEGARKFVTDAPTRRNDRQAYNFPTMRRAGTNASLLNRALWQRQRDTDDISSSSESEGDGDGDDDDDDMQGAEKGARPKRVSTDEQFRRFKVANNNYHTKGRVSKRDGRLNITVNDTSNTGYLAKALGTAVKKAVPSPEKSGDANGSALRPQSSRLSSATTAAATDAQRPKLNIVIMVIGSRGDAQPFLKVGKVLKEEYGHRVRIATHPAFRDFVEKDSSLEFFSVGGDPSELMAFMVKNPGMIPNLETVKSGDIGKRRAAMAEMFDGFWRACINATDNEKDTHNLKMMGDKSPFIADAIIANPPSFAHMHCAEALGIPLHLMFTFPYTPTQAFPHPLATIKKSNVDPGYTNFMSYPLVEMMVWQGLGDLVNDFRTKTLGLDPVSTLWAPGSTYRLHVPFTYMWSPAIVPKPEDWGDEIDISGFVFLDLASSFEPPRDLVEFLDGGDPPIYIGFGSIVVDDADKFTEMIFEGVKQAGVRALVSKGWGGLGHENIPENIFMLENTPHDWLFPKVKACVIHGGAGTTAIALKCGLPTMIVPFFGDQYFWGSMVSSAGAGPEPVPHKKLDAEKLAEGIKYCLSDEAREAAQKIAKDIELEGDGAKNAVSSFHHHLTLNGQKSMRCSILHDHVAVWSVKKTSLKLSSVAADVLVEKGWLSWRKLRLLRHKEWNDFEGPGEPLTGAAGSLMGTVGDFFGGFGSVPYRLAKTTKKREERRKNKEAKRKNRLAKKKKALEPKPAADITTANGTTANGAANGAKIATTKGAAANGTTGFPFPEADTEAKDQKPGEETRQPTGANQNGDNNSILSTKTPGTGPPTAPAAEEYAVEAGKGLSQSGRALARAPIDLSLAISQGFHNAPRLYGDDTVRRPTRVTGMRSGLKAARSEFAYGIYDGVTGIVRLPIKGAKESGVRGALAGVVMGIGGFVLKDLAAIIAPFGYTLKGIAKELDGSRQPTKYIRRARIVQGQRELRGLSEGERKALSAQIYKGWDVMRQVADLIMRENKKQNIIKRHFESGGGKGGRTDQQLGSWGKGRAFESVDIAEKAIAAVKRGEDVETALGKNRKNVDKRKSTDTRKNDERVIDKVHKQDTMEQKEVDEVANKNADQAVEEDVEAHTVPPQHQDETPLEVGRSRSY